MYHRPEDSDPFKPFIHAELRESWRLSRVAEMGGDHSWIVRPAPTDEEGEWPRTQRILRLANKAHGGQLMKFGGRPRMTHEIFCMHMAHNFPDHEKWGIDRDDLVFGMGAHDIEENTLELFQKQGRVFTPKDAGKLRASIGMIYANPFGMLDMRDFLDFMTDDPTIPAPERLSSQKAKSLPPGKPVSAKKQLGRGIDKRVLLKCDRQAREWGLLSNEDLPKRIQSAEARIYVLDLPVIAETPAYVDGYRDDLTYLRREWQDSQRFFSYEM